MIRRLPIAVAVAVLALAAPAAAQKPEDASRVENAVVELSKLKRGSEGQVAAARRSALGGDEGYANYFAFAFKG